MLLSSLLALSVLSFALAAPQPSPDPLHVPLVRRSRHNVEDLSKALAALKGKYNIVQSNTAKRAGYSSAIPITDEVCRLPPFRFPLQLGFQQNDSSYSGEVTIGTP